MNRSLLCRIFHKKEWKLQYKQKKHHRYDWKVVDMIWVYCTKCESKF